MKRKLFFLIEKLEINRGERITISTLLVLLVFTGSFFGFKQPKVFYDPEHYAELEQIFHERSRVIEEERERIMARYRPALPETSQAAPTALSVISEPVQADTSRSASEPSQGLININNATAEQLQQLPGIGPAYAQRIVEWREENGNFTSKEQLLEVRGIGQRRLETIIPLITL